MKKVVDDPRLIYKCCYLYYRDGLSQMEICNQLGISRSTVSRLLKAGKERNVVRIELDNPDSVLYGELERSLESKLGLKEVIIVDDIDLGNKYEHSQKVYEEALSYLSRTLQNQYYVGVSMGTTLYNIAKVNMNVDEIDCTFVPVLGGVSVSIGSDHGYHSNEIANLFAKKFQGNAVQFYAPAVFDNKETMNGLQKELHIRQVTSLFQKLDVVIMGIGSGFGDDSTVIQSGYITKDQYKEYAENGAVGDIILHIYDIHGDESKFEEFNSHIMGLNSNDLKKIPTRIGVAMGEEKSKAVLGALRSKAVNVLITDINCINSILEMIKE